MKPLAIPLLMLWTAFTPYPQTVSASSHGPCNDLSQKNYLPPRSYEGNRGAESYNLPQHYSSSNQSVRAHYDYSILRQGWNVDLQIGGGTFIGTPLGCGTLISKTQPALRTHLGKWFTPSVGSRLSWEASSLKAADMTKQRYQSLHMDFLWNLAPMLSDKDNFTLAPYLGTGCLWNQTIGHAPMTLAYGVTASVKVSRNLSAILELGALSTFKYFDAIAYQNPQPKCGYRNPRLGDNLVNFTIGISYTIASSKKSDHKTLSSSQWYSQDNRSDNQSYSYEEGASYNPEGNQDSSLISNDDKTVSYTNLTPKGIEESSNSGRLYTTEELLALVQQSHQAKKLEEQKKADSAQDSAKAYLTANNVEPKVNNADESPYKMESDIYDSVSELLESKLLDQKEPSSNQNGVTSSLNIDSPNTPLAEEACATDPKGNDWIKGMEESQAYLDSEPQTFAPEAQGQSFNSGQNDDIAFTPKEQISDSNFGREDCGSILNYVPRLNSEEDFVSTSKDDPTLDEPYGFNDQKDIEGVNSRPYSFDNKGIDSGPNESGGQSCPYDPDHRLEDEGIPINQSEYENNEGVNPDYYKDSLFGSPFDGTGVEDSTQIVYPDSLLLMPPISDELQDIFNQLKNLNEEDSSPHQLYGDKESPEGPCWDENLHLHELLDNYRCFTGRLLEIICMDNDSITSVCFLWVDTSQKNSSTQASIDYEPISLKCEAIENRRRKEIVTEDEFGNELPIGNDLLDNDDQEEPEEDYAQENTSDYDSEPVYNTEYPSEESNLKEEEDSSPRIPYITTWTENDNTQDENDKAQDENDGREDNTQHDDAQEDAQEEEQDEDPFWISFDDSAEQPSFSIDFYSGSGNDENQEESPENHSPQDARFNIIYFKDRK